MVKRGSLRSKLHLSAVGLVLAASVSAQGSQANQQLLVPIDFSLLGALPQSTAGRALEKLLLKHYRVVQKQISEDSAPPQSTVILGKWGRLSKASIVTSQDDGILILNPENHVQMIAQDCIETRDGLKCEDFWQSPARGPSPIQELVEEVSEKQEKYASEGQNLDYDFSQVALLPIPRWEWVKEPGTGRASYVVHLVTAVPKKVFDPEPSPLADTSTENGGPSMPPLPLRATALVSRLDQVHWNKAVSLIQARARSSEGANVVPAKVFDSILEGAGTFDKHFEVDCAEFWESVYHRIYELEGAYLKRGLKSEFTTPQVEIHNQAIETKVSSPEHLTKLVSQNLSLYRLIRRFSKEEVGVVDGDLYLKNLPSGDYELQAFQEAGGEGKLQFFRILFSYDRGITTYPQLSIQAE